MTDIVIGSPTPSAIQTQSISAVQSLRLTEGQMVRGTVQQVKETALLLEVNGRTLAAQSDLPLQAGQKVALKVASLDPARIVLQLVDRPATPASPQANALAGRLESLLANWGMEANNLNLTIAESLLTQTLQVDPESVRFIGQQLSLLSADVADSSPSVGTTAWQLADVEALVHLFANDIPISQESLELAQYQLSSAEPTGAQIGRLQSALQSALSRLGAATADTSGLNGLRQALQLGLTQISEWAVPTNLPADQTAPQLESTIPRLATPSEAVLAGTSLSPSSPTVELIAASTDPVASTVLAAAGEDRQAGLDALRACPQKVLHDLQQAVDDALDRQTLNRPTIDALRWLKEDLQTLAKDLAATQMANVGTDFSGLVDPSYVFSIPLTTANGSQTAYLKVFKDADSHAIDPNNTRLALLFDLPQLGDIAVNLSIYKNQVDGQVLSEEATHQLVTTQLDELRQRLSHLGYSIGALSSDMLSSAGHNEAVIPTGPTGPKMSSAGIDLTA